MSTPNVNSPSPPPKGPGRPRDPRIDEAVLDATLDVLDEFGYADLSLEEVAQRAGTSRPAIYRRWSGRAPLTLAAIGSRLEVPSPPDTGCTLCDLGESFNVFLAAYRTIRPEVLGALFAECAPDPVLRQRYLDTVIQPARRAVAATLDRSLGKGDLRADTDAEQLLDLVASLVHYRAMFGPHHLSDDEAWAVVQMLMRGVAVDFPALLAHSEAMEAGRAASPTVGDGRHGHLHPA